MKFSLVMLSLLLTLISCSDQPPVSSDGGEPGDDQTFNPVTVEPNDQMRIQILSICSALEEKKNAIDDYILHRTDLSATYQESDCEGEMSARKTLDVHIVARSNRYEFVNDKEIFGVPEVETLESGLMKEICGQINSPLLKNPIETPSRTAIEFRIIDGLAKCLNDGQHVCIQVKKGPLSMDGTSYRLSSVSLVSFETVRGSRPGFYAHKTEKALGSCGSTKFRTKIVSFP